MHHFKAISEFKLELQSGNDQFGSKSAIFCPMWLWNLTNDLKNNKAPLLCCFKFCASFHSHQWIQTGITVRKHPIWMKIGDFLSCVTLKFDRWPKKTIGHLFYATSSFMYHFVAIQVNSSWSYSLETPNLCQNRRFFEPCDLQISRMTLKNNRAPLLSIIKICASFHYHMWIQTGVMVQKWLNWVLTPLTLTFDLDLLHGHHFCHW